MKSGLNDFPLYFVTKSKSLSGLGFDCYDFCLQGFQAF